MYRIYPNNIKALKQIIDRAYTAKTTKGVQCDIGSGIGGDHGENGPPEGMGDGLVAYSVNYQDDPVVGYGASTYNEYERSSSTKLNHGPVYDHGINDDDPEVQVKVLEHN